MKIRLSFKILLISLFITVICFASVIILFILSNNRFNGYIEQKEMARIEYLGDTLINFYIKNNGWILLKGNLNLWNALMKTGWTEDEYILETRKENAPNQDTPTIIVTYYKNNLPIPIWDPLNLGPRICLFDKNKNFIIGQNNIPFDNCSIIPIILESKNIGWLGLGKGEKYLQPLEQAFRKDQLLYLIIIFCCFIFFLLLIVVLFSKHLILPINRLLDACKSLTQLNFKTRIKSNSSDEIGQLTNYFNNMAQKLEEYERNQNQWLSDISHELRTPLSALLCEIELLQEGIRKVDNLSLKSLSQEVKRLNRLVNDLHELSLAESNSIKMNYKEIKPVPILSQKIYFYQKIFTKKDMSIIVEINSKEADVLIMGDSDRLMQLFANIFENAINYTTKPSVLKIKQFIKDGYITFVFEDTGPGVPEEALPYIFERLYRHDMSRSRKTGGSGLGLAISKKIVEMHNGNILAKNVVGGGLCIEISLPIIENRK